MASEFYLPWFIIPASEQALKSVSDEICKILGKFPQFYGCVPLVCCLWPFPAI